MLVIDMNKLIGDQRCLFFQQGCKKSHVTRVCGVELEVFRGEV